MRFVRILLFLLRMIFGITFILSGFFKLMDPMGNGLVVASYLESLHLGFLSFGAVLYGMLLSTLELTLGIAVIMRLRMKIASVAGLCLMCFFTLLTLFLAIFNPIEDCGCFGEAIHLTNWQTFYKNIVLLGCIIPVFLYRKKFHKVAPAAAEWSFLGFYALCSLIVTTFSYYTQPFIEFGDFKTDTNISLKLDEMGSQKEFDTYFIYEKGNVRKRFTLENLPDSTWTYVETKSEVPKGGDYSLFDFSVTDMYGNYINDGIVSSERPQMLFVVYEVDEMKQKNWDRISEAVDSLHTFGVDTYVLTPGINLIEGTPAAEDAVLMSSMCFSDYKTLISITRSNGGAVYINDGLIVKKWPHYKVDATRIIETVLKDPDAVAANDTINQRLVYEISILLIFVSIILFRYICGIIYGKKPRIDITEE